MAGDLDDEKRAMRAEVRSRRELLSAAQREELDAGVTRELDALVRTHGAAAISCFLSTPTEPGTRAFIRGAIDRGIRVLLPITREDGLLDWTVAAPDSEEVQGAFGVPELLGEVLGPIAVGDVDLMIIPAAAVDVTGMRLGWGRGYYDKTLGSMLRRPPVYAVTFDSEVVDHLPGDVHDQRVDGYVTPSRTVVIEQG